MEISAVGRRGIVIERHSSGQHYRTAATYIIDQGREMVCREILFARCHNDWHLANGKRSQPGGRARHDAAEEGAEQDVGLVIGKNGVALCTVAQDSNRYPIRLDADARECCGEEVREKG